MGIGPTNARRLEDEPVPHRAALGLRRCRERHRAGQHAPGRPGRAARHLVADVLDHGAHAAQQRVLVHRAPAGHGHAERRDGAEREQVQDADVQVGDLQARAPRDDRPGHQRRPSTTIGARKCSVRSTWRGVMISLVSSLSTSATVCSRPEWPDPVRPPAVLQPSNEPSLGPQGQHHEDRDQPRTVDRAHARIDDRPRANLGCRGDEPVVDRLADGEPEVALQIPDRRKSFIDPPRP